LVAGTDKSTYGLQPFRRRKKII